jgi:acid phosphatase (class A)
MSRKVFVATAFAVFTFVMPAAADTPAPAPVAAAPAPLIPASQFDPALLLPAPPADGSPAAQAELAELHTIASARTADQYAAAKKDDGDEKPDAFSAVMGADLTKLPQTAILLAQVQTEEKAVAKRAKDYFKRNRPWIADATLTEKCNTADPQSSYPSGHATMGYAVGVVLAALAPEKATAILTRASQYAENRMVCSMHFRRDIVAGETLGTVVGYALLQNAAFEAQFALAKAELKAAHVIM